MHAILVYKKLKKEKIIAGYVPDILAAKLFGSPEDKVMRIKCYVTGESMENQEGCGTKEAV